MLSFALLRRLRGILLDKGHDFGDHARVCPLNLVSIPHEWILSDVKKTI